MPRIFNYLNYRDFLQDFYIEMKKGNPSFSFQVLANKAGFKSKSFIKLVIDGKKNLSSESIAKINSVLKLSDKAFSYFEDLVAFNQANTHKLKTVYFEKLSSYNARNPGRLVLQQHYEFYSKWYHNTIRELVTLAEFDEDYEALGKMVHPSIPARDARESVQLLLRLGFIKKNGRRYGQTDPVLTTGDEVASVAVANFHLQNLILAGESIDTCPSAQRDISCLVLGVSAESMTEIKHEIQGFRKKLLQIASKDTNADRVYHLALQFFPTSRPGKGESA